MIKKFLQKIFKKIAYLFFIKVYGRIEGTLKSTDDQSIEVNRLRINENISYNIYKIKKGRLYTDRIHDTAVILKNKIIEGPSFQLRNNNNSLVSNNSVFEKGTPRILKNLNGTVVSLLTGGGGNKNYWHWLYDVLHRLRLSEEAKKIEQIDYFLFPSLKEKFQRETLNQMNLNPAKLLSSEKYRHIKADELIVTDHPYILTDNSHTDAQKIPGWIIKWLKEKFLLKSKAEKKDYPKKIFIDRVEKSFYSRFLINEKEIRDLLKQKGFTPVILNELSFNDQVHYFNNADFIIGLHGAGFANLSFCRENTKIIEFRMENTGKVIENLAKKNNLKFNSIICKPESHNIDRHVGHIEIPLNILEQKVNEI